MLDWNPMIVYVFGNEYVAEDIRAIEVARELQNTVEGVSFVCCCCSPWPYSLPPPMVGSGTLLRGTPLPIHWRARVVIPIRHLFRSRSRISEQFLGEPLKVGARTIRPVVRVGGGRGGAVVRLRAEPAGVIVVEGDGREHRVSTPDRTRPILWWLAGVALMVPIASQVAARVLR